MKTVFVSYAKEDFHIAEEFVNDMKLADNLDIWFGYERMMPGQNWELEIKNAISKADYFVCLLSDNSIHKIGFVQSELSIALDLQSRRPIFTPYIIPVVKITNCNLDHPELSKLHAVDYFSNRKSSLKTILQIVLLSSIYTKKD